MTAGTEDHPPTQLVSYAQNGEDVVLWRALGHIRAGNYVDVGAAHPLVDSVTKLFYEHGWSGIDVEPLPQYAEALAADRERDLVVEAGAGETEETVTFYGVPETGLSSLSESVVEEAAARGIASTELRVSIRPLNDIVRQRFTPGDDIHFLKVDVEGAEESALRGFDLNLWRPWVVVVEATAPNSTQSTRETFEYILEAAGYRATLFDGLNVFYVSPDHPELLENLTTPANPLDSFIRNNELLARQAREDHQAALQWKLTWAGAQAQLVETQRILAERQRHISDTKKVVAKQRRQIDVYRKSPWWRATGPGRRIVGRMKAAGRPKQKPSKKPTAVASQNPFITPEQVTEATRQRLIQVCELFDRTNEPDAPLQSLLAQTADLLDQTDDPNGLLWLLHIVFISEFPSDEEMAGLRIDLDLHGAASTIAALSEASGFGTTTWASVAPIQITTQPMIDVSHTARYDLHTGIQRVVRETTRRWADNHDLTLAVLDRVAPVWRPLSKVEEDRVLRWGIQPISPEDLKAPREIVIPWETCLILPELAGQPGQTEGLTAMSKWSNSDFANIFYDMIPFSMSEACATGMHGAFAQYVTTVRGADRVSTISESVAEDLRGFLVAVHNQGLNPPEVRSHLLPAHADEISQEVVEQNRPGIATVPGVPVVLSVSSIEPRKNHTMILVAAEKLWREGHPFQLVFIAGSGWKRELFDQQLQNAQDRGRPVRIIQQASEDLLWSAYRVARFTVFVSLTEGFGLPVAESISSGTPVVLSNFGSMKEVGEAGGAEFVNPRDLDDVTNAMRRLLVDDEHLQQLKKEAQNRDYSTWDHYSAATWEWLVEGR